ncbi:hypothetical protein ABPG77_003891 [Micractinium sp. CCAP 211/92]
MQECPEPNCYTCDPAKNASICFKCGDFFGYSDVGYYATLEGRCAECLTPDCLECEQLTGRCTQCPAGMGAMPDGGCQPCRDDNCASWDGDPEVCKECLPASFIDPKSKRCISPTAPARAARRPTAWTAWQAAPPSASSAPPLSAPTSPVVTAWRAECTAASSAARTPTAATPARAGTCTTRPHTSAAPASSRTAGTALPAAGRRYATAANQDTG